MTVAAHEGSGRRVGYGVAIAVNVILLAIVSNLTAWNWFDFITEEFDRMLWLVDISLAASIAVNALFMFYDPKWFKNLCQLGLTAISIAVAVKMNQVFPFDFRSPGWERLARTVLIFSIVALSIAALAQFLTLVGDLVKSGGAAPPGTGHQDAQLPPHPAVR